VSGIPNRKPCEGVQTFGSPEPSQGWLILTKDMPE
jgi:hypothetical protein